MLSVVAHAIVYLVDENFVALGLLVHDWLLRCPAAILLPSPAVPFLFRCEPEIMERRNQHKQEPFVHENFPSAKLVLPVLQSPEKSMRSHYPVTGASALVLRHIEILDPGYRMKIKTLN